MALIIPRWSHALEDPSSDACRIGIVDIICMATNVLCIIRLLPSVQPSTFSNSPSMQPLIFQTNHQCSRAAAYHFRLTFSATSYLSRLFPNATPYLFQSRFSTASYLFTLTFKGCSYPYRGCYIYLVRFTPLFRGLDVGHVDLDCYLLHRCFMFHHIQHVRDYVRFYYWMNP